MHMSRPIAILVLLLALASMIGMGVYTSQKDGYGHSSRPVLPPVSVGDPWLPFAPSFELENLDGKIVRLADYRGKAVLLNFWATWCAPCKTEMPWLMQFQKKYGPQGLQVVGIAMDEDPEHVRTFVKKFGVTYINLLGTQKVGRLYGGPMGLPATFFIDSNGQITDQATGALSRSQIEAEIKLVLANAPPDKGDKNKATSESD